MADTRGAQRYVGFFFFVIVLFGWLLAGQTNSDHIRACVIMSKNKIFFLSVEIHRKVSILCEQSAITNQGGINSTDIKMKNS